MTYGNQILKDFILVKKSIVPKSVCDVIIDYSEKNLWEQHTWYNHNDRTSLSEKTQEPDIQNTSEEIQTLLNPFIFESILDYQKKFAIDDPRTKEIVCKISNIRLNRYGVDQFMRFHIDHIQSLFIGDERGIPVLSIIINFNDDYDGGELIFWKDYKLKLGCGDIVIFPSLFMFPHSVSEVKKNYRYSAVCWSW